MITKIKIDGVPKETAYNALPFGRQMEYAKTIQAFKDAAKTNWISQKRKKSNTALKEFLKLYQATQYFARFEDSAQCRDDSYQIWFK